ncbi:MAG: EAL domain-containing protein [Hyphomicrobium sp.]
MDGREYCIEPGQGLEREQAPHAPFALFDEQGKLHGWSPAFADNCAQSSIEVSNCRVGDFWPEFDPPRWVDIWRKVQSDGSATVVHVLARNRRGDHSEMVELEIGRFVTPGGALARIEIRRAAGRRLQLLQQEILEAMANGVPLAGIMDTLCKRVEALAPSVLCSVLAVNPDQQLCHLASPSIAQHYSSAIDGTLIGPMVGSCGTAAFRGEPVEVTDIATDPLWADYKHLALPLGLRACWSSPIKAADGRVIGAFAFYYPRPRGPTSLERQIVAACVSLCTIALEHEETRSRAYERAFTDPLTHLSNRARFQQRVSETMSILVETGQRVAVQYIGLDRFQSVNEMLGYAAGDELLRVVATRLQSVVKDQEAVARIGGDEFAVIQVGDFKDETAAARARQIIELIGQPFLACGQRLELGASIGIAIGPDDGNTADELIQDAALAMRRVKEVGRGTYMFYEKALNARMQARRRAESELREALAKEQFELYFQPIYDLQSFEIAGAEALLRWRHPERGMIPPGEFIALAEQCGVIDQLGAWVIRNACLAAAKWPRDIGIAVNLSPVQFANPGLVCSVAGALADSGIEPARLELEITESVLLHDSAANIEVLDELSDLGVSIALDDFGTGYSSLSYLRRFSLDRIKIDHSFVRDITRNDGSLKIVRAIVMLAHSLGLKVTAEGVETDEQLAAVRGEGCDAVQGFYTGAPTPIGGFHERLGMSGAQRVSAA